MWNEIRMIRKPEMIASKYNQALPQGKNKYLAIINTPTS